MASASASWGCCAVGHLGSSLLGLSSSSCFRNPRWSVSYWRQAYIYEHRHIYTYTYGQTHCMSVCTHMLERKPPVHAEQTPISVPHTQHWRTSICQEWAGITIPWHWLLCFFTGLALMLMGQKVNSLKMMNSMRRVSEFTLCKLRGDP